MELAVIAKILKYLHGQESPEELEQVLRYLRDGVYEHEFEAALEQYAETVMDEGHEAVMTDDEVNRLRARIYKEITDPAVEVSAMRQERKIRRWWSYAAAIVLALAVGIYFLDTRQQATDIRLTAATIEPGGNRATLTLGDGRTIDLSEEQSGVVVGDGITYLDGSEILDTRQQTTDNSPLSLTTPKGGTYQITLPDGSKVWLNAASTLTYPSRFEGEERIVEISGEAYFAVANDSKKPFVVKTAGQVVEVLGTEFNVAAYSDELAVKTTLINGAVSVKSTWSSQGHVKLKPGEQSVLTTAGTLTTALVDTDAAIAWRGGRIALTNVPFDALMRQLARWYDIDIVYQDNVPNIHFEGEITRDVALEKVLKFFKGSGLQFEITNDRKLIVKTKKQ